MQAKTKIIVSALLICLIMGAVVSPVLAAEMSKKNYTKTLERHRMNKKKKATSFQTTWPNF